MQINMTPIPAQSQQISPVYRFGEQPRMAGTIPIWQPKGDFATHLNPDQTTSVTAKTNDDGFGFADFIDIINPLHHLPLIGHLYRHITGDEIAPVARVAGGALFGGIAGAGGAIATLAFNDIKDIGYTPQSPKNFDEPSRTAGVLRPSTATTLATAQSIAQTPLA